MNLNEIALLGIDVGFSKSRPTTGIAWSADGKVGAAKTHTDWHRRKQHLPPATTFSIIAVDGPLVPLGSEDSLIRTSEQMLSRGLFQKRCKPGASHFGTGLHLRRAALDTADQIKHLVAEPIFQNAVFSDVAVIEAFPNAFLGVLLSDETFAAGQIARGKKFDWMYDKAVEAKRFGELMAHIGWKSPDLLRLIETERDHDKRAAFVCLLTAACAAVGKVESVGDLSSGWIWLPPRDLWAPWAIQTLDRNIAALAESLS